MENLNVDTQTTQQVDTQTTNQNEENANPVEKTFTQEEVNKIVQERLAKEKKKVNDSTSQFETLQKQLNDLTEKYKSLEAINNTLSSKNQSLELSQLKQKVAEDNNLPSTAIEFLQGKTEEELNKSAQKLTKLLSPTQPLSRQPLTKTEGDNGLRDLLNSLKN